MFPSTFLFPPFTTQGVFYRTKIEEEPGKTKTRGTLAKTHSTMVKVAYFQKPDSKEWRKLEEIAGHVRMLVQYTYRLTHGFEGVTGYNPR